MKIKAYLLLLIVFGFYLNLMSKSEWSDEEIALLLNQYESPVSITEASPSVEEKEIMGPPNPFEKKKEELKKNSESEYIKTRRQLLDSVSKSWKRPQVKINEEITKNDETNDSLHKTIKDFQFPKIQFETIALSDAVKSLSLLLEERFGDKAPNIILIDPQRKDPLVSLTLRNLNLFRILDYLVESAGFTYETRKDALVIRPRLGPGFGLETQFFSVSRSTLIRLTGFIEENSDPQSIPDPFALAENKNSDPEIRSIETRLKDFFQRAGIPFVQIEGADLAMADGQLIVTQTPENLDKLDNLLRRYNEIKQVEIETRFIEVQDRNLEELGFEWTLLAGGDLAYNDQGLPLLNPDGTQAKVNQDRYSNGPVRTLGETFASTQLESQIIIDRPDGNLPALFQRPPQLPSQKDLVSQTSPLANITGIANGQQVGLMIRALERQTGNDLLSAPKVTVLSGKTAEIVVAEEFRYPESYGDADANVGRGDSEAGSAGVAITTGTPRNFTTRNIGVEMKVTPVVEENNAISLRLEPKVTELEGFVEFGGPSVAIASDTTVTVPSGFYQPVFSVRKVNTEVTIWDGATVVMGGLTREEVVRISDRIPLLGDIPLLGKLFRSESESSQKRNLLIFVTATLVSPGGSESFQRID